MKLATMNSQDHVFFGTTLECTSTSTLGLCNYGELVLSQRKCVVESVTTSSHNADLSTIDKKEKKIKNIIEIGEHKNLSEIDIEDIFAPRRTPVDRAAVEKKILEARVQRNAMRRKSMREASKAKSQRFHATRTSRSEFPEPSGSAMDYYNKKLNSEALYSFADGFDSRLESKDEWFETSSDTISDDSHVEIKKIFAPFDNIPELRDVFIPISVATYQLVRSRNAADVIAALYQMTRVSVSEFIRNKIIVVIEKVTNSIISMILRAKKRLVSEGLLGDLANKLEFGGLSTVSFFDSKLVKTITRLVLQITSLSWFGEDVSGTIISWLGKPVEKLSLIGLWELVVSAIVQLLRFGDGLLSSHSISDAIRSTDPVGTITNELKDLLYFEDHLYFGLPVEGKMCIREFGLKLRQTIEEATKILALATSRTNGVKHLKATLGAARTIHSSVISRLSGQKRPVPFMIVLHGAPGVGKSSVIDVLLKTCAYVKRREHSKFHEFAIDRNSEYFEGYQPDSHAVIRVSEVGNVAPSILKNKGDFIIQFICSLADSQPVLMNQAFEGKGKIYACPDIIAMDTNVKTFGAEHCVANPAAVWRRGHYVQVRVKSEYANQYGMLDVTKALKAPRPMDPFLFTLEKYVAEGVTKGHFYKICQDLEISEFLPIFSEAYRGHCIQQDAVMSATEDDNVSRYADIAQLPVGKSMHFYNGEDSLNGSPEDVLEDSDETFPTMNPTLKRRNGVIQVGTANEIIVETGYDFKFKPDERYTLVSEAQISDAIQVFNLGMRAKRQNSQSFRDKCSDNLNFLRENVQDAAGAAFNYCGNYIIYLLLSYLWCIRLGWNIVDSKVYKTTAVGFSSVLFWFFTWKIACVWTVLFGGGSYAVAYFGKSKYVDSLLIGTIQRALSARLSYYSSLFWHVVGYVQKNPRFESQWWSKYGKQVTSAVALFTAGIAIYSYSRKQVPEKTRETPRVDVHKTPGSEASFSEIVPDHPNVMDISELEKKLGCMPAAKAKFVQGSKIWNTQQVVIKPSAHYGEPKELWKQIWRNIRKVRVLSSADCSTHIVGLKGNYAMINTHCVKHLVEGFSLQIAPPGKEVDDGGFCTVWVSPEEFLHLGGDITLIYVRCISFANITKHLASEIVDTSESIFCGVDVRVYRRSGNFEVVDKAGNDFKANELYEYSWPDHSPGLCGQPIVSRRGSYACIAGIHAAGTEGNPLSYAVPIIKDTIESGIILMSEKIPFVSVYSEGARNLTDLEDPIPKSAVHYEEMDRITYYGKRPGSVNSNGKSRLRKTGFGDRVQEILYDACGYIPTVMFGRPMMSKSRVDGEWISPYNNAIRGMACDRGTLRLKDMKSVVDEYAEEILSGLAERGITNINPLDVDEAINGALEDQYIRRINVSTGAGSGFPGKKSVWLETVSEEPNRITRMPVSAVCEDITEIVRCYEEEEMANVVHNVALKDEARAIEKCRTGKTRMFYPAPLPFLILCRMMLAPLFSLMMRFQGVFGVGIGTDMHAGADQFQKDVMKPGRVVIAGDFSKFDISMPVDVGLLVARLVMILLRKLGYSTYALRIVLGLFSDMCYPVLSILLDIFRVVGLKGSGAFGTAEDNSLRTAIICRLAFYSHPNSKGLKYRDVVTDRHYGDDVYMLVELDVAQWFNNFYIESWCKEHLHLVYTPSIKKGNFVAFEEFEDATYLKRKFVFRDDLERWVALLDMNSIHKSLTWYLPSNVVDKEVQMHSTFISALYELFPHLRRDKFCEVRTELINLYEETFPLTYRKFPEYVDIYANFCGE